MRRRDFVAFALASRPRLRRFRPAAQQGLPVIGYLSSGPAEADASSCGPGFPEGLKQQGFVVGRNVAIEYRFADGHIDRLPSLAAELIGLPAAVLVVHGWRRVRVGQRMRPATILIVFPSASTRCSWASSKPTAGRAATRREFTCSRAR